MKSRHSGPPWPHGIDGRSREGGRAPATGGDPRAGAILGVVLILVMVFSTLGLGLLRLSSSIAVDTGGAVQRAQVFWAAEAGLQEARALAAQACDEGQADAFPFAAWSWSGTNGTCTYEVQTQRTSEPWQSPAFRIESRARTPGGVQCRVGISLRQAPALPMALFGVERLTIRNAMTISAYDPDTATFGAAAIGGNGIVDLLPQLDLAYAGSVALGRDPFTGTAAELLCEDCPFPVVDAGDQDPDPLGIFPPGPLATAFDGPAIWTDQSIETGVTNTLTSSGQPYTWGNVTIQNGGVLEVDVSGGPVNVLLTGDFDTRNGAEIRIAGGPPTRFRVFANARGATHRFRFDGADSGAFVYAPGSTVVLDIGAGTAFRGGIWGRDVDVRPDTGARIVLDEHLLSYDPFSDSLQGGFETMRIYRLAYENWQRALEVAP